MKLSLWLFRRLRSLKGLLALYLILLALSYLVRWVTPESTPSNPDQQSVELQAWINDRETNKTIQLAYRDLRPADHPEAPVLVLLHGSPQSSTSFDELIPHLRDQYRLILPDMPGFGGSSKRVADYSIRSNAHLLLELLDQLQVPRAHLLGYNIGGGTALEAYQLAPQRIASLSLVSAIGVQEYELLGNHKLNHALYAAQLGAIWFLHNAVPQFGLLDGSDINLAYAHSFFDTDQRPLRDILKSLQIPTLILHSRDDKLVIPETAEEHYRIVPQSRLIWFPEDFELLESDPSQTAQPIRDFIQSVENGSAITRNQASPERIAAADTPFISQRKPLSGLGLLIVGLILGTTIHISEDLIAISAGIIASQGLIPLWLAITACLVGIYIGDFLIYLAGRWLGTRGARRAPMKWFISEAKLKRSSQWFEQRGDLLVFFTRFIPGTRFPVYFTAGVLRLNWIKFALVFLISCLVWTPLIVGLSYFVGAQLMEWFQAFERFAMPAIIALAAITYLVMRFSFQATRKRHQKKKRQRSQIH